MSDVNQYLPVPETALQRFKAWISRETARFTEHDRLIRQGKGYLGATIMRATDAAFPNPTTYDIIQVHNFQLFYLVDKGRAQKFLYNDGGWLIVGYWEKARSYD